MSTPCVASGDCVSLDVTGDVLTATPIIAGGSNLLACSAAGLLSALTAGPGLSSVAGAAGELTVNLDTVSAVYYDDEAGTNVGAIAGTPSGIVGAQLFVNVANPSAERTALAFIWLGTASDYARVGSGSIWHNYAEYNVDGGAFAPFASHTYDMRFAFTGGVTALEKAGGPMSGVFLAALAAGGSTTYGLRRTLTVTAAETTPGSSFLDDSGNLSIRALVVVQ